MKPPSPHRLLSLVLAAAISGPALAEDKAAQDKAAKPDQLVIVSFDGAHDNALWQKSRDMGKRHGAHFTYFLSCTFLMTKADSAAYKAPGQAVGRSNVGFAADGAEVAARLGHLWAARAEGHEIGSHACGHFDGGDWSQADWESEFATFRTVLADAWTANGLDEPDGWGDFVATDIDGFRAPYLSVGDGLFAALASSGYRYDASLVSNGPVESESRGGVTAFSLPMIPEGPEGRPVIAMDYNLFARHTNAQETSENSDLYEERGYAAFKEAFAREYDGGRVPLQIGFHFVEMNAGAYWRALDRLLGDVCGISDVRCVSYADALALSAEGTSF